MKQKHQRFDDRIVLIFHDQKVGTVQLQPIDKNIMAWSAQGKVGWAVPNRHEISYSYNKIISHAMNDSNWPPQPQIKQHLLLDHETPEIYKTLRDDLLPAKPELMINWSAQEQTPLLWRELEQLVQPVLIGGCPHSGTTLLCSILSAHPDIFTFSCNDYEPLSNHDGIAHTETTLDFTTLYERQLKDLKGKYSHWCECSQANIFYVPEIIEKFGEDARVIHVVRDGRDVITSDLQEKTHRIRVKPERWLEYICAGMKFDACPQILLVRYEDLVFRFDETMLAICEFIGVDFIFDLHKYLGMLFDNKSNTGMSEKPNFIGYSSPGNWKKSPEKELLLDFLSRPEAISCLNHYGYMKQQHVSIFHRTIRQVRLCRGSILSSVKYMKTLRQLFGQIKRKLIGDSMPVLDLIEIHVAIPSAKLKCLYFDKATRVELIRQSVALLSGADKEYVQLLQGDTLLVDNRQVYDLLADDQGDIKIEVIISRFISAEGLFWQDEQLNVFPDRLLSDSAREQADWFYEQNELDSAKRIEQLKGILSEMGNAGSPFVIMAFSSNYTSIFINWVRSCDIHNIAVRERAIIFPMDEKSREVADNEGFKVCFDNSSRVLRNIRHSQNYGDAEFTKHMFFQNAIIRDVLALGCDFLFQDADLVWLEDPFECFSRNVLYDIEFMFDGRTSRHGPLCANTGFIYFHVHPVTVSFWEIIYRNSDRVIEFRSQQEPLNRYLGVLHTRGLNVNLLPEELFANGHLFNPDTEKGRLPKNPKVVHCSWTLNAEKKIEKYKNNNLWFISDD